MQVPDPSQTLPPELEHDVDGEAYADSAHWAVPWQARVAHASDVHVIAVPAHPPLPLQWSEYVQASPSSQVFVEDEYVTVQEAVPLHVRDVHVSDVQVIAEPEQPPVASHRSE